MIVVKEISSLKEKPSVLHCNNRKGNRGPDPHQSKVPTPENGSLFERTEGQTIKVHFCPCK